LLGTYLDPIRPAHVSRLTTGHASGYRPAGTSASRQAFLRARLRNYHAHNPVILRPTRKPCTSIPPQVMVEVSAIGFPGERAHVDHRFPHEHSSSIPSTRSPAPFSTILPPAVQKKPCMVTDCFSFHRPVVPGRTL
jgi:hypothetical protein